MRGAGVAEAGSRAAAFANEQVPGAEAAALVGKVAANAWKVTAEDLAAAKAAGLPEDAIFELVVCAALGQASRQLASARAAVDAACAEGMP